MSNPVIEILSSLKIPTEESINEETFQELVQICPAVKTVVDTGESSPPTSRGFVTILQVIFDMLSGSGLEEMLPGITDEYRNRVDKLMAGEKYSLVRNGVPIIPAINDVLKQKPTPFASGLLLGLACVVKRAEEEYGQADATVKAFGSPKAAEPVEEAPKPKPKPAFMAAAKPATTKGGTDHITKILSDLHAVGVDLNQVSLKPEQGSGGISLKIAISLGTQLDFEAIAKLNAVLVSILGKNVSVNSASGMWIQMNL